MSRQVPKFSVKIADAQHPGSVGQLGTYYRPDLHPAVKGRPQERKWPFLHALVFQPKIGRHQPRVRLHPGFVSAG